MSLNPKDKFARELTQNETGLNLARATLLVSAHLNQSDDDSAYYLLLLDDMAEALRPRVRAARTEIESIAALNHYLFVELGFSGNEADYYNPTNSFLDKVLDLKTGIPISLSLVYLEIGWRLGLPLQGIGMPAHFIVSYQRPGAPIYLDIFNGGKLLSEEECLALSRTPLTDRLAFRQQYLVPATKKVILFRLLLNLKQIYLRQEAWELVHRTVDLMLLVRPGEAEAYRDRGLAAARLNRLREATFDLQRYLYLAPAAPDAGQLKQHLDILEQKLSRLN